MKKVISLMLAVMMAFPVQAVMAEEVAEATQNTQTARLTFTVDSAVEYAVNNGSLLKQAEAQLKKSQHEEYQARRNYNDYASSGMSFEEALVESGYYYKASQIQTESAKRNIDSTKNNITVDVKSRFYTCLNYKSKIAVAKENLDNAQQKYEYAQKKYEQGTISQLELKTFKTAVSSAQLEYNDVSRKSELALSYFKYGLEIPQETEVVLLGEFSLPELTYVDDAKAKELVKNQNSYLSIAEGRELSALRYRIANGWYSANEIGYSIEYETYTSAMINYLNSENNLMYNMSATYNNLLTLKESIDVMNESVSLLKERAEASFLQYELGMITANDYVEAEQSYYEAKNNYIDTQLSYYLAVMQYVASYSGSANI